MPELHLKHDHKNIEAAKALFSFQKLKTLYADANSALAKIASSFDDTHETSKLEDSLLDDKDFLIKIASKMKCTDMHEISQKVDFLKTVHLDEKSADDFSLTDRLTQSIWEDCQAFL